MGPGMWADRLADFVTLFLVVNPIGVMPAFMAAVETMDRPTQRRTAVRAVVIAFFVLLFFMFAGNFLLAQMGVSVRAFQIAGGIVLCLIALDMIRHEQRPESHSGETAMAVAIYPIAIPKIAGPGAMLAVMLLIGDDKTFSPEQLATIGVLALVMAITLIVLLLAVPLSRLIGHAGIGTTERVMGFFLLALAVNTILTTLVDWLSLPRL